MSLKFTLYTPTRIVCNTVAEEIVVPVSEGSFAIKERHQKHSAAISVGLLRLKNNGSWTLLLVFGGILHIQNNKVSVFVSDAQEIRSVDVAEVQTQLLKIRTEMFKLKPEEKRQAILEIERLSALLKASLYLSV
jgi:F-type H+-transporting ATPase subunit epsilon